MQDTDSSQEEGDYFPDKEKIENPSTEIAYWGQLACDSMCMRDIEGCTIPERADVAVGIIGGATSARDDAGAFVGELYLVCAPYSTKPWSDNFRFLKVMHPGFTGEMVDKDGDGTAEPLFQDILHRASAGTKDLSDWLWNAFELRFLDRSDSSIESTTRPPSLKMCPPNYVLSGLKLNWHDEDILVGVSDIDCTPVNQAAGTTSSTWGPRDQFPLYADTKYQGYRWSRKDSGDINLFSHFSLDQRIGVPRPSTAMNVHSADPNFPDVYQPTLGVPSGWAIHGFRWGRDADGRIRYLRLREMPAPRP
jgi:hypothetical protein